MKKQRYAYLIDFDNTLFDTDKLKREISSCFSEKFGKKNLSLFWKTYSDEVHKVGYFDIKNICKVLSDKLHKGNPEEFEEIFLKQNFKKYAFSKSGELIKMLKKRGKVILYTLGDTYYQPIKIKNSGIGKLIGEKNIYLTQEKSKTVGAKILELKTSGYDQIVLIDDRAEVLEKAKKIYPEALTIWFKYGKNKNLVPKDFKLIDKETESQEELIFYLQNYISRIKQNVLNDNISIQKNITGDFVRQLIKYTAKDSRVSKFTHDNERFKSARSFSAWKNRKKYIYTMSGRKGKLYGIIWFSKKQIPLKTEGSFKYTFAIRTYKPARGKGLSGKFMQIVFENFGVGKDKNIWLKTQKDNKPARKLYENYGFKMIGEEDKEVLYFYKG